MDGDGKIILENSADLYKLPIHVLKNTKIYNFKGKYFDKIYEEALKIERSGGKAEEFVKKKIQIDEIELEIHFVTNFGQKLIACGSLSSLGSWDWTKATPMVWNEGNIWKTQIPFAEYFEYKFVLIENERIKKWENGGNKIFNYEQIKSLIEKDNTSGEVIVIKDSSNQIFTYDEKKSVLNVKCQWTD